MDLSSRVLTFARQRRLFVAGETVLVGISGGADSTVLAHVLQQVRHELSINVHLAHFNHRLRVSAETDQKCVERFASQHHIPLQVGWGVSSRGRRVSEAQAREQRLHFFLKICQRNKIGTLALAHTRNDLAETVLLRLTRGSGLYGLRAIIPKRQLLGLNVVRPLLELSRSDIESYARKHALTVCHDETNADASFLRNKIRRQLLPYLRRGYNPQIIPVLADLAQSVQDDYDFLNLTMSARLKENVVRSTGKVTIKLNFLTRAHPALRRMALRHAFEYLTGDLKQLTFKHVAEAEELIISRPSSALVHWPQSINVKKLKDTLELTV